MMTSTKRFLCINKSFKFKMTISQKVWFPIWNKDIHRDTKFLYWHNSLFLGALLLYLGAEKVAKKVSLLSGK